MVPRRTGRSALCARPVNRIVNIVFSLLYSVSIIVSCIGEQWVYYLLGSLVEVIPLAAIARTAWNWSSPQIARSQPATASANVVDLSEGLKRQTSADQRQDRCTLTGIPDSGGPVARF